MAPEGESRTDRARHQSGVTRDFATVRRGREWHKLRPPWSEACVLGTGWPCQGCWCGESMGSRRFLEVCPTRILWACGKRARLEFILFYFLASINIFTIYSAFILLTRGFQRRKKRLVLLLSHFNKITIILFTYAALFTQGFQSALQTCTN